MYPKSRVSQLFTLLYFKDIGYDMVKIDSVIPLNIQFVILIYSYGFVGWFERYFTEIPGTTTPELWASCGRTNSQTNSMDYG